MPTSILRGSVLWTLAGLLLWIGLSGCNPDYRQRAVGPTEVIHVVMDSTQWKGELGTAIKQNVAPFLSTLPAPERAFTLRQVQLDSERTFDNVRRQKNVLFVAPLSDSSNVANFLRQRLSDEARQAVMNGQSAVVPKPDLWRRDQRVYFVTAATPSDLIAALQRNGNQIRETFHEAVLGHMNREMFDRGRQPALEDSLMEKHGFAVNMQHDYYIATDTSNFVWLRRVVSARSWRSLFVYYIEDGDPSMLSPEWVYATRDSLSKRFIQGSVAGFMKIDYRRPLTTEETNFLDRFAYESYGLWHMVGESEDDELLQYGGGGPFVNYTFYDQASDRIYMIDGSVFAPGYDKLEFLRQMEVIAHTFRTRHGPAAQQPVTAQRSE